MSTARIAGIVLLVVGVVLFIVGMSASNSITNEVSEAVTGTVTDGTAWYIYGGLAAGLLGLLLALFGGAKAKHA
jgi:hypothetical protein